MLQAPSTSNVLLCVLCTLFLLRPQDVMLAAGRVRSHFLLRTAALCPMLVLITFVLLSLILYSQWISLSLASAE